MIFNTVDWIIIVAFLALSLFIGVYFRKSAGKGMENFFLGGRNLPWYIAGISMVATTFAADTPLAITEIVAKDGISGNWIWWNALIGGTLTTFFFAKLWRRSGVLTEVELIEKRYSGKKAKFLRGFKSIYLGVFMNLMVIGWVNLAMITILQGFFPDLTKVDGILICGGLTIFILIYSTLSGLLGIAITDTVQFFIAIIGCIVLAALVVNSDAVGGIDQLKHNLPNGSLNFFPEVSNSETAFEDTLTIGLYTLIAFFGMVWWASWYPGAEPGGGGYVAQRMMSAKSEKDSVFATLFFQIGHFCIRPWPWILVALSAMVIYSVPKNIQDTELRTSYQSLLEKGVNEKLLIASEADFNKVDKTTSLIQENKTEIAQVRSRIQEESRNNMFLDHAVRYRNDYRFGFIYAIRDFLPNGLLGLLFVVFLAAYMSTISTQLNWGASYIVNDFYAQFVNEDTSQSQLVLISKITTLVLGIVGVCVSFFINSISEVWKFIMEAGAGLGLVLILRWYWWRINAWSEISATLAPFIGYGLTRYYGLEFPNSFFCTVIFTTIVWIVVTFITQPTQKQTLEAFYQDVQPEGFWEPIRNGLGIEKKTSELGWLFLCWVNSAVMIYSTLFLIGKIIFKEWVLASMFFSIALIALIILQYSIRKTSLVDK